MSPPTPKRRRIDDMALTKLSPSPETESSSTSDDTEISLAILLSLHPNLSLNAALEALLASKGNVEAASILIKSQSDSQTTSSLIMASTTSPHTLKRPSSTTHQTGLATFLHGPPRPAPKIRHPQKGETLHLYTPLSITAATPTTLIPTFLPSSLAITLLHELLTESTTFPPPRRFQLFDRAVVSPHTSCFFLRDSPTAENLESFFSYQARKLEARQFTPSMAEVTEIVEKLVNETLKPRKRWRANAALVNRYEGKEQSVGWHTDELTYLGPRAVIASVSLGCEREFRVRRAVAKQRRAEDNNGAEGVKGGESDRKSKKERDKGNPGEGQYSIHLQHNSLLIMHGGMQEAWKHCIPPARTLTPHLIAGDIRINITYRFYRPSLKPGTAPICNCNLPTTLRPKFPDSAASLLDGHADPQRYFWACAGAYVLNHDDEGDASGGDGGGGGDGSSGCGFFQYTEFDKDGELVTSTVAPRTSNPPDPNTSDTFTTPELNHDPERKLDQPDLPPKDGLTPDPYPRPHPLFRPPNTTSNDDDDGGSLGSSGTGSNALPPPLAPSHPGPEPELNQQVTDPLPPATPSHQEPAISSSMTRIQTRDAVMDALRRRRQQLHARRFRGSGSG
ncbi:hypothetical protein EX30DRAFT_374097 [Ascodesmis nigricans]|uniref:Fe2OG dioxygenase domain-containing protein n=1 Tax=Ascodesmis nigricans TaxID=341454 RepID=A0A4S2MRZ6_9PEZI|nr:hypothetical protein EX30DRAFT_374097 [Ascodesmis nigricans]